MPRINTEEQLLDFLTPELRAFIIADVNKGHYLSTILRSHGVPQTVFKRSFMRWRDGEEVHEDLAEFFDLVVRSEGVAEKAMLDRILDGHRNWQAAAWYLERRFHDRWGRPEDRPPPPPRPITEMTERELIKYREKILKKHKARLLTGSY